MRGVGEIEEFAPDLKRHPFGELEVFEDPGVNIVYWISAKSAVIALSIAGHLIASIREGADIEEIARVVDRTHDRAIVVVRIAGDVRTLSAAGDQAWGLGNPIGSPDWSVRRLVTCQPPTSASRTRFMALPKCLPRPKGKS